MLTYTTHRVLGALHAGTVKNGIPPSQREIAKILGLQVSKVNESYAVLEQRGFIERERGKKRRFGFCVCRLTWVENVPPAALRNPPWNSFARN